MIMRLKNKYLLAIDKLISESLKLGGIPDYVELGPEEANEVLNEIYSLLAIEEAKPLIENITFEYAQTQRQWNQRVLYTTKTAKEALMAQGRNRLSDLVAQWALPPENLSDTPILNAIYFKKVKLKVASEKNIISKSNFYTPPSARGDDYGTVVYTTDK